MKLSRFPVPACFLAMLGWLAAEQLLPAPASVTSQGINDTDLEHDKRYVLPRHKSHKSDASPDLASVHGSVRSLDALASGQALPVIRDCRTRRLSGSACASTYDLQGSGGGCNLETLLVDIFPNGRVVAERLQRYSRKIVQPAIFKCSRMYLDKCNSNQELRLSCASVSGNRVEAQRFIVLESVTLEVISLGYRGYANAEGNNWMRLRLQGVATLKAGSKSIHLALAKEFERPAAAGQVQTAADFDPDVTLDIPSDERGELNVIDVLSILQKTAEDIYPQDLYADRSLLNFEGLKFSYAADIMHIELGMASMFSLNVLGRETHISGSPLLNSAELVYLVCQSGEDVFDTLDITCGIAAKYLASQFNFESVLGLEKERITKLQAFEGLGGNENVLLLSSKRGVAYSGWKKLKELGTIFDLSESSSHGGEMLVPPGLSVKFKMSPSENFMTEVPNLGNRFVFAWPEADGLKMQIPTLGGLPNIALQGFLPTPDDFSIGDARIAAEIRQEATIIELRIKRSPSTYCLTIAPNPVLTVTAACKASDECALDLRNTTITKCYDETAKKWDLSGNGVEANVVGSMSNTTVAYEDHIPVVKGNLLTSNMAELSLELAKYGGYTVPDNKIVPDAIANFTILDLHYKAKVSGNGRMELWGNAKVCANRNANFEAVFHRNVANLWRLGTCITFADADLAALANLLLNTVVLSQGWLHFKSISFVFRSDDSEAGDDGAFESATCLYAEVRSTQGHFVRVAAVGLDLSTCHGVHKSVGQTEDESAPSKPCLFLRRVLGASTRPINYDVLLQSDKFYAEAYIRARFDLGGSNKIALHGVSDAGAATPYQRGKIIGYILTEPLGDGGNASFRGTLVFGDNENRVHAELLLRGESIVIVAPPMRGNVEDMQREDNPNLLMIPHVQMTNNRIRPYEIPHDEPLEYIVFTSGVKIGSSANHKIYVSARDFETKQYVYGVNAGSNNKFVACAMEEKHFTIEKILLAFDITDIEFLPLRRYEIMEVCFAYQNSETVWNISSKGILAPRGLHLFGRLDTLDEHKRPIMIEFKGSGEVVVKMELPPLRWATSEARQCPSATNIAALKPCPSPDSKSVDHPDACLKAGCCWSDKLAEDNSIACHQVSETLMSASRLEMVASTNSPSVGPLLTVVFAGARFSSGKIEGFTSGIGFAEPKTMYLSRTPRGICKYELEYQGLVYGEVRGTVKFTAKHCGINIPNAKFQLEIDVEEDLQRKIRESAASFYLNFANATRHRFEGQVVNASRDLESWKVEIFRELQEGDDAVSAMERELIEHNKQMQNSANNMRRSCVNHCRPVHMPTWKWNDACIRSSDGHSAGCMKYDRSAHIVSNVGCLAMCEAGRVRALSHVLDDIAESQRRIPELAAKLSCTEIGQHLRAIVLTVISESEEMLSDTQRKMSFLFDLETVARQNPDTFVSLERFELSCALADVVEPKCFNFTIEVDAARPQGEFSSMPETVAPFCFSGLLSQAITQFALNNLHAEFRDIDTSLNAVEKSFAIINHKRRSEITDVRTAYQKCVRERKQLKESTDRARAAAEGTESANVRTLKQAAIDAAKFSTAGDETILSFKYFSPWATLDREEDPFVEAERRISRRQDILSFRRVTHHGDHPCNVTRRSLGELQDISEYMKTWSKAHEDGRQSLHEVKNNIKAGLHTVRNTIEDYARAPRNLHAATAQISYWMNETDRGMERWFDKSAQLLAEHDLKGMSLLKRNLESAFAGYDHGTMESYLNFVEEKATKAYKRSFERSTIHDEESFPGIVKNIRSVVGMQRLSEANGLINSLSDLVTRLDKRTLSCTM